MPSFDNIHHSVVAHEWTGAVVLAGVSCLGEYEIKLPDYASVRPHVEDVVVHLLRKLHEYPLYLGLLLEPKLPDLVVQVHEAHGLDEKSSPRGALVVDYAVHASLVLSLDRKHVPVAPHREEVVLQVLGVAPYQRVDLVPNRDVLVLELPSCVVQKRARPVGDLVLGNHCIEYVVLNAFHGSYPLAYVLDNAVLLLVLPHRHVVPEPPGAPHHGGDSQKFSRLEDRSLACPFYGAPCIVHALEGRRAFCSEKPERFAGLLQVFLYFIYIVVRLQDIYYVLACVCICESLHIFEYLVKLKNPQRFFVQSIPLLFCNARGYSSRNCPRTCLLRSFQVCFWFPRSSRL